MNIEFEIKNYRIFSDSKPAKFTLTEGITSFLGMNNAGKSTLLKFFYEFRTVWSLMADVFNFQISTSVTNSVRNGEEVIIGFYKVTDLGQIFHDHNDRPLSLLMRIRGDEFVAREINITIKQDGSFSCSVKGLAGLILGIGADKEDIQHSRTKLNLTNEKEFFQQIRDAMYIGAFRNAINSGGAEYFDLAVGTKFVQNWRDWSSGDNKKNASEALIVQETLKKLFGFQSLQITPSSTGETINFSVDGQKYTLNEVGAGLSQFFVVLASIAMKRPWLLLIDEPELSLHPSLQIQFVQTIHDLSKFATFISSHSMGLVRSVSDKIYFVKRVGQCSIVSQFTSSFEFAGQLGELSYSALSELGCDTVLFVEGVTELRCMQIFLRLFKKESKVVLVSLDGSTMINPQESQRIIELKRIVKNVKVLIDSEKAAKEAVVEDRRAKFKEKLESHGVPVHVLQKRAFDNYLTTNAIKKVKGDSFHQLGDYQKLGDAPLRWGKGESSKIAFHMSKEDLEGTDLGDFLEQV